MKKLLILSLAAFGLLLQGCSAPMEAGVIQEENQYQEYIISHNLLLATRITVVDIKTREVGDLMQAQIQITNDWNSTLDFKYKFMWFDDDGFEINVDGRPWTPIELIGNEVKSLQSTAPNPSAKQFKIYVQE